mmetsp:Transcript_7203/g.14629  ORF Transcript_7203/g.14629 Transcript_7203/m.14629 type:complete len:278 (-) Transcript_7203:1679-2512(-)
MAGPNRCLGFSGVHTERALLGHEDDGAICRNVVPSTDTRDPLHNNVFGGGQVCVHDAIPGGAAGGSGQGGFHVEGVRVEGDVEVALAPPVEAVGQEAALLVVPVVLVPPALAVAQELAAPQQRVGPPELDHLLEEAEVADALALQRVPVEMSHPVVVAVGVVVAVAREADLIPHHHHGRALRHHQRSHEVFHLPRPQALDRSLLRVALVATVPAVVVVAAVAAALPVGHVVLAVVGHQVAQCEPVVCRDEVDAMERLAVVVLVQICGAGQPRGKLLL